MQSITHGGRTRYTYSTFADTHTVTPLRFHTPRTFAQVREIVLHAARHGYRVRALGAGHSWSDVALCPDVMIDMRALCNPLEKEEELLRPESDAAHLFRTEANILIQDLAAALKNKGLALPNISGFIGQTLVGATQTATHGSGLVSGPLSDFIVSLDVMNAHGEIVRVEPSNGITDPQAFRTRHPERRLIQDDRRFHAIVVSMGSMGIVHSVYVRVMPYYFVREDRTTSPWSEAKKHVLQRVHQFRHYEFAVNPHPTGGQHTCLELTYDMAPKPTAPAFLRPHRNPALYLFAAIPGATTFLRLVLKYFPGVSPAFLDLILCGLKDRGSVSGYEDGLTLGTLTDVAVRSSEYALPMSRCVEAVDTVLRIAEASRKDGLYHSVPVIVRFVKKTPAYLAMQYGGDADEDICMVECPSIVATTGADEQNNRYEQALYAMGARPHWGQYSYLSGSNDMVRSMYPQLDAWLEAFREFNDTGMFDNVFTDRLGFSRRAHEE